MEYTQTTDVNARVPVRDFKCKQLVSMYRHKYAHLTMEARDKVYTQDFTLAEISSTSYMELLAMLDFRQLKFQSNILSTPKLKVNFDESNNTWTHIASVSRDPVSHILHGFTKKYLSSTKQNIKISADFTKLNAFILIPSLDFDDKIFVNYFEYCLFGCRNKVHYIKKDCSLAQRLRKSNLKPQNHKSDRKRSKKNKNYAIDLTNYKLCIERLNKYEKYNIIKDMKFCYQFINDQIIVIPDNYFYFIHFAIDKHNFQCPLNGSFSICINHSNYRYNNTAKSRFVEIYRVCNSACYCYLKSKLTNQIIISHNWKNYYNQKCNKTQIVSKLATIRPNVLQSIDQKSKLMKTLCQLLYCFKLWQSKSKNGNNINTSINVDDNINDNNNNDDNMMLCRLYDRYTHCNIELNSLLNQSPSADMCGFIFTVSVNRDAYCQIQSMFDNGSTIVRVPEINCHDQFVETWIRLPDNNIIRSTQRKKVTLVSDTLMYDSNECHKKMAETTGWPFDHGTVFKYFESKYPNYQWVYKRKKDGKYETKAWAIKSPDGKHILPRKYFDSRYRILDCHYCGKRKNKMLICGKCKSVRYCNKKCQKRGWKLKKHNTECHQLFCQYISFCIMRKPVIFS